jgi:hypothetical protein
MMDSTRAAVPIRDLVRYMTSACDPRYLIITRSLLWPLLSKGYIP